MSANQSQTDFVQQLMDFRASYLRGVARAAVDLEFRRKLTKQRPEQGQEPLDLLQRHFGYECPWDLKLVLHDDPIRGPRLNPANGTVMTQPYCGESITVYIPKKPEGSAKEQMDALTAFYQQNQWFLHRKRQGAARATPAPAAVLKPPPVQPDKWSSVAMKRDSHVRFDLGVDFNDFISFGAALFNAVALAWDNELFMRELTAYKGAGDRKRTVEVLQEWLGYKCPWEFDLIVAIDESATFDAREGKWESTTPPVLMLTLPWMTGAGGETAAEQETAANQKSTGVAIMGVALYNTDGPGYPFTCG